MPISGKQHVLGKPAVGGRLGCWVAVMSHCSDTEMGDWHKTQGDMKEMGFFVFVLFLLLFFCLSVLACAVLLVTFRPGFMGYVSVCTLVFCRAYNSLLPCLYTLI